MQTQADYATSGKPPTLRFLSSQGRRERLPRRIAAVVKTSEDLQSPLTMPGVEKMLTIGATSSFSQGSSPP